MSLNMNTGDQKYIDEFEDGTSKLGPYEDTDIASDMLDSIKKQSVPKPNQSVLKMIFLASYKNVEKRTNYEQHRTKSEQKTY